MLRKLKVRIKEAREARRKWRRLLAKRKARQEDIVKAIKACRKQLTNKRERLRKDKVRGEKRQAEVADEIEELETRLDQLVERLDQVKEKRQVARHELKREARRLKRLKERRERIKDSRGDLTKHFSMAEFNCREGDPVPSYMEDDLRRHCKLFLEPLRKKFGPVRVTSGHRWTWYNAKIGGASQSYHCYEVRKSQPASDLVFSRGRPSEWAAEARRIADSYGFGGVGQYATFVHVDPRVYRSNWYG